MTNYQPEVTKDLQLGAVLVFKPGTTVEEAQAALAKIRDVVQHASGPHAFNPDWGGPVWYVP